LLDGGIPVLGVVFDVTRDLVYSAAAGEGAWLGNQQLHVRTTPMDESSMLMMTSNLIDKAGNCPAWAKRFISQTDWKVRMLGTAALEAIQVAAGVAHGAITVNGKLWDVVAPAAVVLEAGGIITDLGGRTIFPYDLRNYQGAKVPFLAAGPVGHGQVLREILAHP
jgi:myo-inositol-1(or 4)-monophosphatase